MNNLFSAEGVALVLKKKGDVKYKPFSSKDNIIDLGLTESLYNQDQIITGDNGFTKVVYLDDGSLIKIHKESEIYIQGSIKNRKIVKNINIVFGKMKLDVSSQSKTDFLITTPTSIATIKGTRFWINCKGESGDLFIGLSGNVEIKNLESGDVIVMVPNETVNSLPDGSIIATPTKEIDLYPLEKMEDEMGELTEEKMMNSIIQSSVLQTTPMKTLNQSTSMHQIRIKLLDADGNEKELIIDYTE